jgi:hypothetical protein
LGNRPCPLMGRCLRAGRDWSERAKALGIMAQASPRPGSTVPGTKKSPQVERREALPCASVSRRSGRYAAACYQCAFRRSASPHCRGEENQKLTSRGGARAPGRGCLKCESKISQDADKTLRVIRGLDPRIHPSGQESFRTGWIAGSSPAMTEIVSRTRCSVLHAAAQSRDRNEHRALYGPGSAAHRSARATRCAASGEQRVSAGHVSILVRRDLQ